MGIYEAGNTVDSRYSQEGEIIAYLNADEEKAKTEIKVDNVGKRRITGVMYLSRQEGIRSSVEVA